MEDVPPTTPGKKAHIQFLSCFGEKGWHGRQAAACCRGT